MIYVQWSVHQTRNPITTLTASVLTILPEQTVQVSHIHNVTLVYVYYTCIPTIMNCIPYSQLVHSIVKVVTLRQPTVLFAFVLKASLEIHANPTLMNAKPLHTRMESAQIQWDPFSVCVFLVSWGICVRWR